MTLVNCPNCFNDVPVNASIFVKFRDLKLESMSYQCRIFFLAGSTRQHPLRTTTNPRLLWKPEVVLWEENVSWTQNPTHLTTTCKPSKTTTTLHRSRHQGLTLNKTRDHSLWEDPSFRHPLPLSHTCRARKIRPKLPEPDPSKVIYLHPTAPRKLNHIVSPTNKHLAFH